jgi:glycosyltransferase involved in cell wall biosynthesis
MVNLIRGLDPTLFAVHAACFEARGPWLDAAAERAVSIAEFSIHGFARPATWRQVAAYARWCRRQRIAAVITSDFYTNVFGLTGAAMAGVPVRIAGRREINTDKTIPKLLLQRGAYALSQRIVANSRAAAARLRREGVRADKVRVVSNGVTMPNAIAPRVPASMTRAIVVANLRPEKGHDVLIDAMAARPELRRLQLDFAGDGPCRANLEARARRRGVADRISFLGERGDIPALLDRAHLFILPSRTEALPNSVMEAMAAGLPVVASRTGGICELIDDRVTGILVPPGDAGALADAIVRTIADPVRAAALGAEARSTISARFGMSGMVSGFTDILLAELHRRDVTLSSHLPVPASGRR